MRNWVTGFYILGYEFLPGDHVWVDTYDGETYKGVIDDVYCWPDMDRQVIGVELTLDDGEYLALDDYDIAHMDFLTEEEMKNEE